MAGIRPPDAQRSRSRGNSAFIPLDVRMHAPGHEFRLPQSAQRAMDVTISPNQGVDFVAEQFIPSLIEYLRSALVIRSAGATLLSGLQGHVVVPKQVGPSLAFWLTETGLVPDSTLLTNQVPLRPRRLSAQVIYPSF